MSITHQDMEDWHGHPVTRALFRRTHSEIVENSLSLVQNAVHMDADQVRDRAIEISTISRFIADLEELEVEHVQSGRD